MKFPAHRSILIALTVIGLTGWLSYYFIKERVISDTEGGSNSGDRIAYDVSHEVLDGVDYTHKPCGKITYCDPDYLSASADDTYVSTKLGVQFSYITRYVEQIVEKENAIYIIGDRSVPLGDEEYHYAHHLADITVFEKKIDESLEKAVRRVIFHDKKTDCSLESSMYFGKEYLKPSLQNVPQTDDNFQKKFFEECKILTLPSSSYFVSRNNWEKFFLIDTRQDHPIFVPNSVSPVSS